MESSYNGALIGEQVPKDNKPFPKKEIQILETDLNDVQLYEECIEMCNADLLRFDYMRVTMEKKINRWPATVKIGGADFAKKGNISGVGATSKAFKSSVICSMASGCLTEDGSVHGAPDIQVLPNTENFAVIHVDSEQSEDDHQDNVNSILRRAGLERTPDHFLSYNFRQLARYEYEKTLYGICQAAKSKFGGVMMVFVDIATDFVQNVNDEKESQRSIQFFLSIAIEFNCAVILTIHQNPGSDKERGHYGSEFQRKCFALIGLTKKDEIVTVVPKLLRKASPDDVPLIKFKFDSELGYIVQIEGAESGPLPRKGLELIEKIFSENSTMSYSELTKSIETIESIKSRAAQYRIDRWQQDGLITKEADGNYRQKLK
ncbi:AAA family ATPase [Agriterribacter sp.]|uniref:AAA family ATPase n=1 Tax=Agriterribacter sp. TaxID=2821509 RepID=UPI002C441BAA|nr:AAA family ATPase [Agriterribacter sp.]HTN09237.1 AAA family ATPase [Agriterribacter sp.]